ncbi:MAG: TolC family protein [candidate division Zixibacteria bacterium]|nr:TolC family protein [candidate division Zixibacteria bacterium]
MNLKHLFPLIFCLAVLNSSSLAQEPLTLQACLSLAKENNPKLIQRKTTIEQAQVGVTSAYSSYYPSVNLSSSYRNNESPSGGRSGSYSSSFGLSLPLYQGGNIRAGVKIARIQVQMAEENYRQGEDEVILSVKEAFFKILLKREQIALAEDILKRRKEDLVLIKLKYDAGRESSPAVKEAEANLLQAEYDKKQAEEELILAQIELNLLLGRPRRAEVSIKYEHEDIRFPSLDRLIEEAKTQRPDIRSQRANTEVLEAQVTQAKSNYFPKISLSSSYGMGGSEFLDQEGDWSAGISFSLPIFKGFSTKAKVQESTLSLKEQDVRIQELEQQIEEEIEQAYSKWGLAEKVIEVNDKTLQATREMYQLTKLQYEQGLTSYFFLQQKESDLTRAENNYVSALYNLRVYSARLQKAWGGSS